MYYLLWACYILKMPRTGFSQSLIGLEWGRTALTTIEDYIINCSSI